MKNLMHLTLLSVLVGICQCGKDSSGNGAATSQIVGVWTLKSLVIEKTNAPFTGDLKIEFKSDNTFVSQEAYRSIPIVDYGPCWGVTRGSFELAENKVTTTDTEEKAWIGCETPVENKKSIYSTKMVGSTLVLTSDSGIEMSFERDAIQSGLDFNTLKTLVEGKSKVVIDRNTSAYVEDANENDNWQLLETECNLSSAAGRKIKQYFRSQLLGSDRVISADYSLPSLDSWVDGKFTVDDSSSSCNAPGLRSLKVKELQQAKGSNDYDMLYSCGGKCVYSLISETHNNNGEYSAIEVSWECLHIGNNTLSLPGVFGLSIDKHVGKVSCK